TIVALLLAGICACSQEAPQIKAAAVQSAAKSDTVSFSNDVRPILETRCIACHACYDAPCQLKLTAYDGVQRGGSKVPVYDPERLREAPLTRLFLDAHSEEGWRAKGFHSVVDALGESDASILEGMLALKTNNPLPDAPRLPDDLPLDDSSSWQCAANLDEFADFADDYPQRGMPYGLPGLSDNELATIDRWVADGAVDDTDYSLSEAEQQAIARWETFLNKETLRGQLVARYVYEHLFLGSLYFPDVENRRYFQLVRSRTPPGTAIDVIATRRPYDDPGVERVYYRLRLNHETTVAKTHMPYRLDSMHLENWTTWFFDADYEVNSLPSYDIKSASNPFKTFAQLPAKARYLFMLSESNFTVKGFIKGPVCKGQSAVNVISEHFWVFFIDPDYQRGEPMLEYLASVQSILDLPAEKEDTLRLFTSWDEYAEKEKAFLQKRRKFVAQHLNDGGFFDLDLIWDGDGKNPNAAITVFRHFDHASVQKGLISQPPKTAWVIDYPLLERVHYLLVAGYDVYGNVSHQLLSRIYMDFLRMEGESMFLLLLPADKRKAKAEYWYRGANDRVKEFFALTSLDTLPSGAVAETVDDPQLALYDKLEQHIGSAMYRKFRLDGQPESVIAPVRAAIDRLQAAKGRALSFLPHVTYLEVLLDDGPGYFTLIKNVGHTNNTSILLESLSIEPDETTVSIVPGFIGPRPYAFMQVGIGKIDEFTDSLLALDDDDDYGALMDRYGIRRTRPDFWTHYDRYSEGFRSFSAVDYGVLDLNKLENR
ncbi:MAG: hypothetical protein HKN35_03525, partial [Woeseia sp.]|nr:hypothetical protein [Woeseia sp.]